MVTASLIINIFVLIPVCAGLILKLPQFVRVFGPDCTARQILMCIYLAILFLSAIILFLPQKFLTFLIPLLLIQVFYKLASVIFIQDKKTPVLWFNLTIAIFHMMTIYSVSSTHSIYFF